jgi:hypothetical protein
MSSWHAGRALVSSGSFATPRTALWTLGTVGLEATARALGRYDIARGRHAPYVWEMSATTKHHIEDAANAQRQHNVAVFHIAGFHGLELEIGPHACRQLTRRVAERIQRALGPAATVSTQQAGTVVALLPGGREAAERAARALLQLFEAAPVSFNRRGVSTPVTLTCGIIAFPQSGPPLSTSVPLPQLGIEPVPSIAT